MPELLMAQLPRLRQSGIDRSAVLVTTLVGGLRPSLMLHIRAIFPLRGSIRSHTALDGRDKTSRIKETA